MKIHPDPFGSILTAVKRYNHVKIMNQDEFAFHQVETDRIRRIIAYPDFHYILATESPSTNHRYFLRLRKIKTKEASA